MGHRLLYGILDDKTVVLLQYYVIDPITTGKYSLLKTQKNMIIKILNKIVHKNLVL